MRGPTGKTESSPIPTSLLTARGLEAGYGPVAVLRGVDIEVGAGEVVALLGANAAGKSTTLRALAGVIPVAAGTVKFLDGPASGRLDERVRQGLAYVPEERTTIMGLSVEDNLRLGQGSVDDALDIVEELRPLLKRRAGLLSGGEQQMLILARALAAQPKVLLADEMSLGLAPKIVDRLFRTIARASGSGVGVLVVEQHARKALDHVDRAYVMRRGEIVLEGSAAELKGRVADIESSYLTVSAN